jgi:hypothetical protein
LFGNIFTNLYRNWFDTLFSNVLEHLNGNLPNLFLSNIFAHLDWNLILNTLNYLSHSLHGNLPDLDFWHHL